MLLLAGIKIILEVHVIYTCSVCLLSVLCTLSTMQICHCCRHSSSNRVINCQLNFSLDKLFDVFESLLIFLIWKKIKKTLVLIFFFNFVLLCREMLASTLQHRLPSFHEATRQACFSRQLVLCFWGLWIMTWLEIKGNSFAT